MAVEEAAAMRHWRLLMASIVRQYRACVAIRYLGETSVASREALAMTVKWANGTMSAKHASGNRRNLSRGMPVN
jgi:hypothetical protein